MRLNIRGLWLYVGTDNHQRSLSVNALECHWLPLKAAATSLWRWVKAFSKSTERDPPLVLAPRFVRMCTEAEDPKEGGTSRRHNGAT